jgi:hypothetical protein
MTHMNDGKLNVTYSHSLSMGAACIVIFNYIVSCLLKGETGEYHTYSCIKVLSFKITILEPTSRCICSGTFKFHLQISRQFLFITE